jgi:hypothetical protein
VLDGEFDAVLDGALRLAGGDKDLSQEAWRGRGPGRTWRGRHGNARRSIHFPP